MLYGNWKKSNERYTKLSCIHKKCKIYHMYVQNQIFCLGNTKFEVMNERTKPRLCGSLGCQQEILSAQLSIITIYTYFCKFLCNPISTKSHASFVQGGMIYYSHAGRILSIFFIFFYFLFFVERSCPFLCFVRFWTIQYCVLPCVKFLGGLLMCKNW